jgi:DNA invertase Pin-like site-specific DNA recombinase
MKAIIYTRFSPRPDSATSSSNLQQESRCRAYCVRQGYEQVGPVFADAAVSGKALNRPGLQAALAALESGMVLIVDTSDRLARDMLVALTIRHQIDKAGASLEFADGSPNHTTPEGELFANILAAFAQYERTRFARRTREGLAKKKAAGEWLGRPPVGYRLDRATKKLIPHPGEQMAIAQIQRLAMFLTSAGVAKYCTDHFGLFRGKPWSARTVRKILSNV